MTTETVSDRIDHARRALTPTQLALGLLLVAVLGATIMFLQEPMVHDAMHNVRHGAGITCH